MNTNLLQVLKPSLFAFALFCQGALALDLEISGDAGSAPIYVLNGQADSGVWNLDVSSTRRINQLGFNRSDAAVWLIENLFPNYTEQPPDVLE